jgi:hypothetical protein
VPRIVCALRALVEGLCKSSVPLWFKAVNAGAT